MAIGLLFVFLSCEKGNNLEDSKDYLEIIANKTIIKADGVDEVEFSVFLNGEELFYGYTIICDNIPIEGKRFNTTKQGKYTFVAIYDDIVSRNLAVIHSVDAIIPKKPSNFNTAAKSLLTFMPFISNDPVRYSWADSLVKKIGENELTKDKFIKVTNPILPNNKWVFPKEFYNIKIGVASYPYIAFNHERFSSSNFEDAATCLLQATYNLQKDAVNVGINSILYEKTIVTRILLKAAVEGNYYVGAFLVEDNVEFIERATKYQYDAVIRHIDCGDYIIGNKVGHISKSDTKEHVFVWNLDNIREIYNASENNWGDFVNENLRVIVYVYSEDKNNNGLNKFQFNNVVEKTIDIIGAES